GGAPRGGRAQAGPDLAEARRDHRDRRRAEAGAHRRVAEPAPPLTSEQAASAAKEVAGRSLFERLLYRLARKLLTASLRSPPKKVQSCLSPRCSSSSHSCCSSSGRSVATAKRASRSTPTPSSRSSFRRWSV